ncbi:M protein repeat protein [Trichostrongylus colubriformis]|uniref:M protein repeat protein n=1 Tax=Trichostrongylus colubriformis TaxID=6319 RepID=A0AAN8IBU3_TRICO
MSERLRERFGYFTEELDGPIRPPSPGGSRSPRRASRSPRPQNGEPREIAVAIPLVRDSRPEINPWPAPPQNAPLTCISGNVRTPTAAPIRPSASPVAVSPVSNGGSVRTEIDDSTTLLTMLRVAAATNTSGRIMDNELRKGAPRGRETELKRKIQTLEETVAEYERQKYNVMGTFSEYRERVAERERKLEAEYSSKIIALSDEVLGAKKDFEARMKSFQALQDKFEREKEQALEKLRQEHQKEIQLLEQRFSESQLLNLEQKYMMEIQRLEEERKSLRSEKERLGETFEMKLRRAQSLYETELTAAKMLYTKELEALRDHEDALKDELLARQDEFHDRLQELQHQAKRSREELVNCRNEVEALERKLDSKEVEVQAISKELEDARAETNDALKRLSLSTSEYNAHRQKYQEQEMELREKSNLLAVVEAAKAKLEVIIRDLQTEVRTLKNKVEFLEKERANLQSQSESQAMLQNSQVKALEAVLESVTKEKEAAKEHYENILVKERQQAEAREHAMKKEFSSKLNELEEQYTCLKEDLEHSAKLDRNELRESTQYEISTLQTEKALLEAEVKALKQKFLDDRDSEDQVAQQLSIMVTETAGLTRILDEYRERIHSKDEEITSLQQRVERELSLSEEQLRTIKEELRNEMFSSEEYRINLMGSERLQSQISDCERKPEKSDVFKEEGVKDERNLERENEQLRVKVRTMEEAIRSEEIEALKSVLTEKDSKLDCLEEELTKLKDENKKLLNERERSRSSNETLQNEMAALRSDNSEKTNQIESLHMRIKELMGQMGAIREELEKKNIEIQHIGKRADIFKFETSHMESDEKLNHLRLEHEKIVEDLKQREADLKHQLEEMRDEISASQMSKKELVSFAEQLKEEVRQKVEMLQRMEKDLKENEDLLKVKNQELDKRADEISLLKAKVKKGEDHYEKELRKLQNEASEKICNEDEGKIVETFTSEMQTDPISAPAPIPIVDLAREKELKSRITELEHALEVKNDLIEKLHEQLPHISGENMSLKKKDRSQSMTTGVVFQNFVSQMKDKRDETNERNRKREAEKKAAKEAPRDEVIKSPLRSKSPSLLTRLRERSPVKTRSPLDNLELTPSTSSR